MPLQLTLNDGFTLRHGAQIIAVPTEKARALLAYLAVSGQAESRRSLAALFWPRLPAEAAAANLTQTIWLIRRAVAACGVDPLLSDQLTLRLNPSEIASDCAALDEADRRLQAHDHRDAAECPACLQRLRQALTPLRLGFAIGLELQDAAGFNEWLLLERERRRRRHVEQLTLLARASEREQQYARAADELEQALRFDHYDEGLQQRLVRVLAFDGRRMAALERRQQFVTLLRNELGIEADAAGAQVAEQIRHGLLRPPALPPLELPYQPPRLFGRDDDLLRLHEVLSRRGCRLVTISGIGGVGKTALAAAAAPAYRTLFSDGVYLVALGGLTAEQALTAVVGVIARHLPLTAADWDGLAVQLDGRQLLLILDNVEVRPALQQALSRLLTRVPGLIVLATARRRLGISAEQLLVLHGLDQQPGREQQPAPAVALLLHHAAQAVPGEALPDQETAAQICRLLGGLPLALLLAARHLRDSSAAALLALLQQQPQQLAADSPDLPLQHRRIGLIFTRIHHDLPAAAQQALAALLLCRGSFSAAAAEAVVGDGAAAALRELHERGLLIPLNDGRRTMHPLIRTLAAELNRPHDLQAARQRHAAHYLGRLAAFGSVQAHANGRELMLELSEDFADLHAAWQQTAADGRTAEPAALAEALARLALHSARYRECLALLTLPLSTAAPPDAALLHVAVTRIAMQQNDFALGAQHAQAALACSDAPLIRVQALRVLAQYHSDSGRPQQAEAALQQALPLTALVPAQHAALLLYTAGRCYGSIGQLETAEALLLRARDLARQAGDGPTEVRALDYLAQLPARRGDLHASLPLLEAAAEVARERGDVMVQMTTLNHLASLRALCDQPAERFVPLFDEALQLARSRLLADARIDLLHSSGYCFARVGLFERAAELLHEGLSIAHRIGMQAQVLEMVEGFGLLDARCGRPQRARRCLQIVIAHPATMAFTRQRAEALLRELPPGPSLPTDAAALQQLISELLAVPTIPAAESGNDER
jgi:DNA-binding SARP family transcriptional activator/predicted ATPase